MRAQPVAYEAETASSGNSGGLTRFGILALGFVIVAGVIYLVAGNQFPAVPTMTMASSGPAADGLIPDSELPRTIDEGVAQSAAMEERYPDDPRVRVLRAIHFFRIHDLSDAESQLRTALDQFQARPELDGEYESMARLALGLTLFAEGKPDAARTVAAPACDASANGVYMMDEAERILREQKICD